MSIEALNWVWGLPPLPSLSARIVLLTLADRADERNTCYPSIQDIAGRTQVSPRSVRRALSQLDEAGYLERTRMRRADGTLGVYRYLLHVGGPPANLASGQNGQDQRPPIGRAEPPVEPPGPPPQASSAREIESETLEDWLDDADAIAAARAISGWSPAVEARVVMRYFRDPGEELYGTLHYDYRTMVVASALIEYQLDGARYHSASLDGFVRAEARSLVRALEAQEEHRARTERRRAHLERRDSWMR